MARDHCWDEKYREKERDIFLVHWYLIWIIVLYKMDVGDRVDTRVISFDWSNSICRFCYSIIKKKKDKSRRYILINTENGRGN